MITFEQILGSVEYTLIKRTNSYIHICFNSKEYVFYKENILCCFSINEFRLLNIVELIEQFIPMNNADLISVSNCSSPCDLTFDNSSLSYVLGQCFKLHSLETITDINLIDNDIPFKISLIDSRISKTFWKYSIEQKMYYLIPSKSHQTAIKFNTSDYYHYGKSLEITNGKNPVIYLNPYTLLVHIENGFIENNQKITIGIVESGRIVIRSTYQELISAFDTLVKDIGGYYLKSQNGSIKLHIKIPFREISDINNSISGNLNQLISNFEDITGIKYKNKPKILVLPNPRQLVDKSPSTIVEFTDNLNSFQIIIEHLLNSYSQNYKVVNINYVPMNFINKSNPSEEMINSTPMDYFSQLADSSEQELNPNNSDFNHFN